nr:glycosyl hydrolase-related protein [Armatimonadota bacterium]
VLGDKGDAWSLDYTGEKHLLTTGADVEVLSRGPVCAVVRVHHMYNKSTFTQDITLWNGLGRLDVPTTVEWHEHGQALKVAFPLNMAYPAARAGIPYGSIDRPTSGQEYPGQKWMDVTEQESHPVAAGTSLPLDALFNNSSANFDGQGRGYDSTRFPPAGLHRLGASGIPFRLPGHAGPDNVACNGQVVALPPNSRGKTLYLLGAATFGDQGGMFTVEGNTRRRTRLPIHLNDWVNGGSVHNEDALSFGQWRSPGGIQNGRSHVWITSVALPAGDQSVRLLLPYNSNVHLFAATLAVPPSQTPRYGLTVLNDCKYGADTLGNVFRLTLLRSSHDPDPNPDEGTQTFTYSLLPHAGDWRTAQSEQAGLALNIPLQAVVTDVHHSRTVPLPSLTIEPAANVLAGALKHCEDSPGYILRLFETQGRNTTVHLRFSQPVQVQETDLLERPLSRHPITIHGGLVTFPIGHDQIVTLRVLGLPDAGGLSGDVAEVKPPALGQLTRLVKSQPLSTPERLAGSPGTHLP